VPSVGPEVLDVDEQASETRRPKNPRSGPGRGPSVGAEKVIRLRSVDFGGGGDQGALVFAPSWLPLIPSSRHCQVRESGYAPVGLGYRLLLRHRHPWMAPPDGYEWHTEPAPGWRAPPVATTQCRRLGCWYPPVAEVRRRSRAPRRGESDDWWGFCAGHLETRLVDDGVVKYWVLKSTLH